MPRLEVDGKGSRPVVAALVHAPGCVIEDPDHGDQADAVPIGTGNVVSRGSDAVNGETNSSSRLGDEGTLLQGVVDALDTVAVDGEEEAAAELVPWGGGGVGEKLPRQEIECRDGTVNILSVDAQGHHPHQHLMGPLQTLPINLEQVGPLTRFEPKI